MAVTSISSTGPNARDKDKEATGAAPTPLLLPLAAVRQVASAEAIRCDRFAALGRINPAAAARATAVADGRE